MAMDTDSIEQELQDLREENMRLQLELGWRQGKFGVLEHYAKKGGGELPGID